jgi:hypothetical protein
VKLESLILARQSDGKLLASEWLEHHRKTPGPAGDAEIDTALGVIGRRDDRGPGTVVLGVTVRSHGALVLQQGVMEAGRAE